MYFYRLPKAPDLEIHGSELDLGAIAAARIFWMTGTGLCAEPSRSATLAALGARSAGAAKAGAKAGAGAGDADGITVFDLDWRPMFWSDPAEARPHYAAALAHATVAVGNLDEVEIATGCREPAGAARALLAAGVELAVVKQGPKGVLAMNPGG
ncbi:5-dehydro-2-deoxygluconokinase OS=Streptomyces alboniger OX=132473 GN=iolC PE=3 SV=1 [Streptomyces alboniger]